MQIVGFFVACASILLSTLNTSSEHGTFSLKEEQTNEDLLSPRPDFFHLVRSRLIRCCLLVFD